jgi:hypothetical protein
LRIHFGLGAAKQTDKIEVVWPSGTRETFSVAAINRVVTLTEGKGDSPEKKTAGTENR